MRRAPLIAAVACAAAVLVPAATTQSHPGHGFAQVDIGGFQFKPRVLDVVAGDTVIWYWQGPDRNHSVTADPGAAEAFDSDPNGNPSQDTHATGSAFTHTFTREGSYGYFCKVHTSMRGTINVGPAPAVAPPDTTPPALGKVRATRSRTSVLLTFTLGEASDVLIEAFRLDRRGRAARDPVLARDPRGKVGTNRVRISTRKLRRGRYRFRVLATDAAGNTSRPSSVVVPVRR